MSVGLSMGMLAAFAMASPPVLDRVPTGAMMVVTASNPTQLHKDLQALTTAIEIPFPVPGVDELLQQMGIEKGVDSGKSIALAVMPPGKDGGDKDKKKEGKKGDKDADGDEDEGGGPPKNLIIFLPVTSYADFLGNFDLKPGGGVDAGRIQGDDAFFKDLGNGYAAMSPTKELLEGLDAKASNGAAFKSAMGKAGEKVADTSSFTVIVNMDVVRPMGPGAMKALEERMVGPGPGGMAMGQLGESVLVKWVGETMMRDTRTIVAGVKPDAMGVGLDIAMVFNDGSYMAKAMTGKGTASELITKLPNQTYLFAFAVDLSMPGMRTVIDDISKLGGKEGQDRFPPVLMQQFNNSQGSAMMFGAPPGGLLGGLFTSTVGYVKTQDPGKYIEAMRAGLTEMNGKDAGGMTLQTTYEEGSAEVNGTKVDTWGIKLDASADGGGGQMAMALPMIFGPAGGPGGYVAKTEGGVVRTYSKNSLLMGAAMDSAKGGGDNLGKDKLLSQVGERLPKDRVAEAYVGVKSILEAVMPLLAMGGVNVDIELPPTMPPIGLGMGTEEGGARIGLYLPAPVIKTVSAVVMQARQGGLGGPRGGGKKDDQNGAGQPRF